LHFARDPLHTAETTSEPYRDNKTSAEPYCTTKKSKPYTNCSLNNKKYMKKIQPESNYAQHSFNTEKTNAKILISDEPKPK